MTRRLSEADREIWDRLRKTVRPLRKHRTAKPAEPEAPKAHSPAIAADGSESDKPAARRKAPAPPMAVKAPPALAPFEDKTLRRLGRGLIAVDARIDLHGMRQERAHAALLAFLRHAQARGHQIVLVVTGKGKPDETVRGGEAGRGVLRQVVPGWLAHAELRPLVAGFEEAGRRHGGAGALYVRIRRRRERAAAGRIERDRVEG
jgi:DNA-nicking Smr family endonuclease